MVRISFDDRTLVLAQANGCRLEDTEVNTRNLVWWENYLNRIKSCRHLVT